MLLELTPNYIDINNSLNNDTLKYLLCYPDPDSNSFKLRLNELKKLVLWENEVSRVEYKGN